MVGWPAFAFLVTLCYQYSGSYGLFDCEVGAGDTLGQSMSIRDAPVPSGRGSSRKAQTLVSSNGIFELGFFSPSGTGNSNSRYIGIWYKKVIQKPVVVWIANRELPLHDPNRSLTIRLDGSLTIESQRGIQVILSSPLSTAGKAFPAVCLKLRDSGNLVLTQGKKLLWQSFDYPSDTYLPGMRLGVSKFGETTKILTSWKSEGDPSRGAFSLGLHPNNEDGASYFYISKGGDSTYWMSGFWNGQVFSWIPETGNYNFSFKSDGNGSNFSYPFSDASVLSRLVLDASGKLKLFSKSEKEQNWTLVWHHPNGFCDVYASCGPNSICSDSPHVQQQHCKCLLGFEPCSPIDWRSKVWSAGCKRQIPLGQGARDRFKLLKKMRLPAPSEGFRISDLDHKDCETMCQKSRSCKAYASVNENGSQCYQWSGKDDLLFGIQENSRSGHDLYIRVEENGAKPRLWIMAPVMVPSILIMGASICYLKRRALTKHISRRGLRRHKAKGETTKEASLFNFLDAPLGGNNGLELQVFSLATISAATDNFSLANKLGEGGFGPVYKGNLHKGQVIAVKRLSGRSSQGLDEFRNEIILLARLQHINLVRVLGYCTEGKEKILVYEYTPNKSLDSILFDVAKQKLLDWEKRVQIINGIIQGLLYLHKYSRLRIIHRDLKPSNVLLDSEMNPKISDFGLARIFGQDELEVNTKHIAGTLGYMPPEYARGGLFSEKSDVFSFGVLLLEIISGKKNTSFNHFPESSDLLGYAWEVWKNGRSLDLVDPTLLLRDSDSSSSPGVGSCSSELEWEFTRCIHVGLLCVQESARDRPTMSDVASFLQNSMISLPTPTPPPFTFGPRALTITTAAHSYDEQPTFSVNLLTMSIMEAR